MKDSFIALIAGLILLIGVGCAHRPPQFASFDPVDLPGTGDSQDLLRTIAEQYHNEYPTRTVTIPDSISSSGGIKVVGTGEAPIGRVARLPLPQEKVKYGEFNYIEFARVPVVFAVSRDAGVSNLSQQQICDIYSGRITNWQDIGGNNAPIKVQSRPEEGSNMILIRKEISCFTDLKITPNANANYRNFHMIESMQAVAGAIGFMPLSEAKLNRLNAVTLDSVDPLNPQYKLGIGLGFVHKEPLSLSIQAFLDYLHTEPARAVIRQMGNLPVERTLSTQTH